MSTKRKVSFYRIGIEHERILPNKQKKCSDITKEEIQKFFMSLYENKMQNIGNGRKAISIRTLRRQVILEVMKVQNSIVFAKIGQENTANTVGLRDSETLKTENVPMTANQQLELFTYCLIDFATGIISYIGINGAPKISAIKYLFADYLGDNYTVYLDSILTDDILTQLVNKSKIGGIRYSVALPPDEILNDSLSLGRNEFDEYRNINRATAEYVITAKRNKNIFVSSSYLSNVISAVQEKFGDHVKSIRVKAKNDNEKMQEYNLFEYNFSKIVDLETDKDVSLLDESDFYSALKTTYDLSKSEIMRYIR